MFSCCCFNSSNSNKISPLTPVVTPEIPANYSNLRIVPSVAMDSLRIQMTSPVNMEESLPQTNDLKTSRRFSINKVVEKQYFKNKTPRQQIFYNIRSDLNIYNMGVGLLNSDPEFTENQSINFKSINLKTKGIISKLEKESQQDKNLVILSLLKNDLQNLIQELDQFKSLKNLRSVHREIVDMINLSSSNLNHTILEFDKALES